MSCLWTGVESSNMVCCPPSTLLTVTHMFTAPRKWSVTSKGIMSFTQRLKVAEPLIYVEEKKPFAENCYLLLMLQGHGVLKRLTWTSWLTLVSYWSILPLSKWAIFNVDLQFCPCKSQGVAMDYTFVEPHASNVSFCWACTGLDITVDYYSTVYMSLQVWN